MEANNEIKDFNIAEALKYAPKGLKLYSPLFGEIEFGGIENGMIRITGESLSECFYEDGRYYSNFPGSECLLFPSVNHRCWQHWQNTLFLESIGSVCVGTITGNKFILDHNGTFFSDGTGSGYSVLIEGEDTSNYLLNSRYATPEETKEFFDELKKNGYEWDGKMVVKSTSQPKFKVGDWVVQENIGIYKVIEVCESWYEVVDNKGKHYSIGFDKEYMCHLWTIQDAKDGDVLACGDEVTDCPFIFHNLTEELNPRSYCGVNTLCHFQNSGFWCDSEVRPATKEQCDLLFQKMKEAGYEWDADTKKPIKTTFLIPKFKVGDIIKHKDTGIINSIKRVCSNFYILDNNNTLYFEAQDMWELVSSKVKPTLEEKVNILADEIIALKQRVLALEIQVIKDMSTPPLTKDPYFKSNKITCDDAQCYKGKSASDAFETPDKAGDCVTLKDMKS